MVGEWLDEPWTVSWETLLSRYQNFEKQEIDFVLEMKNIKIWNILKQLRVRVIFFPRPIRGIPTGTESEYILWIYSFSHPTGK